MVIDADALNLISQNPELIELVPKGVCLRHMWVSLTGWLAVLRIA